MGELSEGLVSEVEAVLTDEPVPLRIVHQRVDCWAKDTIALALRKLIRTGRARAEGDYQYRVYRR